ncbi:MAG TPA: hypothetical protein DCR90_03435 [Fusobacteriaceae bacterium]|nr:hypothetical protein [Fusobacteriaceae bacterium]
MMKKLEKKNIRIIILLVVTFLIFTVINSKQPKQINVKDYMPSKPMVKVFDGEFNEAKHIDVIDKIDGEFYQKKNIDINSLGVLVYHVDKDSYKLIYTEGETNLLKDNYIDEKSNTNLVLLRTPIKKGVSWINDDKSTYKILSVDEKIDFMGKKIKTIKLRYRKDEDEYYLYFSKGLGIVAIESELGRSQLVEIYYDVNNYLSKIKKLK